jgi:hypothetical protein
LPGFISGTCLCVVKLYAVAEEDKALKVATGGRHFRLYKFVSVFSNSLFCFVSKAKPVFSQSRI